MKPLIDRKDFPASHNSTYLNAASVALMLQAAADAVIEWQNPGQAQFGIDRLIAFLEEHKKMDLDEILEKLLAYLKDFSQGRECGDDLTMLCLEFQEHTH